MSKKTLKEIEDETNAALRETLGLLMMPKELEADLKKLQTFNPEQTKFVVWPLEKLIWLYEILLAGLHEKEAG